MAWLQRDRLAGVLAGMRSAAIALAALALATGCSRKSRPASSDDPRASAAAPGLPLRPARPSTPAARRPSLPAAAFSRSFAESANTPEAWTAVADAYDLEYATCRSDCRALAADIVDARKAAATAANLPPPPDGEDPVAVPPVIASLIDALDRYVASLPATDDDVAKNQFLAAAALWRYRQPDSLPRLEALLREHRYDETAEYAANQLLDFLMRAGKTAELAAWVAELAADETFLADKPALRETLRRLQSLLASTP